MNAISEIVRFQVDRELDRKEYDSYNEHVNIVEELIESVGFDVPKDKREKLKLRWIGFVESLYRDSTITGTTLSVNCQVDAYCDVIVFAVGALMKLGVNPELALLETAKEINSREGKMINGKFEKDLSDEAKAKWYKADYSKVGIV